MRRHQLLRNGLLLLVTALANGKMFIGTLRSPSCFEPIAKFAYATTQGSSQDGRLHARIQFREGDYRDLHMVTYNQDEWRKIYKSKFTCAERLDYARLPNSVTGRTDDHLVIPVYERFMQKVRFKKFWEQIGHI